MSKAGRRALQALVVVGMVDSEAEAYQEPQQSRQRGNRHLDQELVGGIHKLRLMPRAGKSSDLDWTIALREEQRCREAEQSWNHGLALAASDR
jgi:hypothetical protein